MASVQPNVGWQSTKNSILERNRHMFNNADMSDINFTCEGSDKTFYAHKYVLGTSSAVFHAMFYGEWDAKDSISLPDTNEESLEQFLRFLYTEECTLTGDNVIAIMYLSNKYSILSLYQKCVHFLAENLNPENVLDILEQTSRFDKKELEKQCWKVIVSKTDEVVRSDSFINISHETLTKLLKQDILKIQEADLFQAVLKWIDFQCSSKNKPTVENRRSVIGEAIYEFRFFTMSHKEFVEHVSKSNLLTAEEINRIHEKFVGFDSPSFKWNVTKRSFENLVRFSRYSGSQTSGKRWNYGGKHPFSLVVSVNKEVSLRGVRLFGDNNRSEYQVTFEVKESKVQGTYISEPNQDSVPGFDVMLEKPVTLEKDVNVILTVTIEGSDSVRGDCLAPDRKLHGVHVKFTDISHPKKTWTVCFHGPFHEIILAI